MSTYRLNVLVTLALLVLIVLQLAKAQADVEMRQRRQRKYSICGPELPKMMSMICQGNYNPMFKKKDEALSRAFPDMELNEYRFYHHLPLFRSRRTAKAMLSIPSLMEQEPEKRRGIADECCYGKCSLEELLSYCATSK